MPALPDLYSDEPRTYGLPRPRLMPESEFLDISAWRAAADARSILSRWLSHYPSEGRNDIVARIRSSDNSQHTAAIFELTLHELFHRNRVVVTPHPALAVSNKKPDFHIRMPNGTEFYLEATMTSGVREPDAPRAQLRHIFHALDKIISDDFMLLTRNIKCDPPGLAKPRKIAAQVRRCLDQLSYDLVAEAAQRDAPEEHNFEVSDGGVAIVFTPIHKRSRGRPTRLIASEGVRAEWVETDRPIREALRHKTRHYGPLSLPLVVAVNVMEWIDDSDMDDALFGKATGVVPSPTGDGLDAVVTGGGLWAPRQRSRRSALSAVLWTNEMHLWNLGASRLTLIRNPAPEHVLADLEIDFRQVGRFGERQGEGRPLGPLLGLTDRCPADLGRI